MLPEEEKNEVELLYSRGDGKAQAHIVELENAFATAEQARSDALSQVDAAERGRAEAMELMEAQVSTAACGRRFSLGCVFTPIALC